MALYQIKDNPLLQTHNLIKTINEIDIDAETYILANEIPMREIQQSRIKVDVRKGMGGMTKAAKSGAESPMVSGYGMAQWDFEPAEWREKVVLSSEEVMKIRKLGTENEVEQASAIIARFLADLRNRLETRMEWCRWQCLFGSLTVNQNDVDYSLDYNIPADMRPTLTGADLWSASTSDPMDDILEWLEKYSYLSSTPMEFLFGAKLQRILMQNSKIRTLRDALFTGQPNLGNLTPETLNTVFKNYTGIPFRVYNGGYWEMTDLTTAVSASGTTLVLRDVGTMAVDDIVTITDVAGEQVNREILTIASVTESTNTITVDSPGLVNAYAAGATARVKKHFIPDERFVIHGKLPANAEGGPLWAEMISTVHPYGPGGMENPQAGIFSKVNVDDDGDPPHTEIIAGVYALPVMYHRDVNILPTVL